MSARTALVVDDSKSARFALRKFLEGHAYKVDTAESAEEAISFLKQNRPEVIFMDHVMPGTDGFDALRLLKADPHTVAIPVVMCSSNEGNEFTAQARSRGAADVLQKPPNPQQLGRILANMQQLSASYHAAPQAAASAPETSAPPASKVANRQSDVAIEQSVMNRLRGAMNPEPAPPAMAAAAVPAITAAHAAAAPAVTAPSAEPVLERRLAELSREFQAQIAHLRIAIEQVGSRPAATSASEAALEQLRGRLTGLESSIDAQLAEMRAHIDAALMIQSERIDQIVGLARSAAGDEAHAVAERTVMSAASRISDQLAQSILKVLGKE